MYNFRKIIDGLYYVGVDDYKIEKFEGFLPLAHGVSYNSYLIKDEKNCLMDTVDQNVSKQFFENVEKVLDGEKLDYLVVLHMEPDHCYNLMQVLMFHKETIVVGNEKTFAFISQFFPSLDLSNRKLVVKENDTLCLGKHTLQFIFAPMVHWPEVMIAYEQNEGLLFSADAFGMFNTLDGNLYADNVDFERDYLDEARRYYTNIVGKYGLQVSNLFKKVSNLSLKMILPLHGFIWRSNLSYIIDKYVKWSSYICENKSVLIIFASMYGNTLTAASIFANELSKRGVKDIKVYDASITSSSILVSETFKYSNILLLSPTYNMNIYPPIEEYLNDVLGMSIKNRTFSLVENGTWATMSNKLIKAKLENSHLANKVTPIELSIISTLKEKDMDTISKMCDEIVDSLKD